MAVVMSTHRAATAWPSRPAGFRLVAGGVQAPARVQLDEHQARVAAHRDGPLLVLAGPGTGKTTTLVESVAALVERADDPLRPDQVLALTFSRRAASQLRERITSRLARTTGEPMAWTFHSFCYALVRAEQSPDDFGAPLRLLSGPEQDAVVRDLLGGSALGVGSVAWPAAMRAAMGTRGLVEEIRSVMARARELGLDPEDLALLAWQNGRDSWAAVADFLADYLDVLDSRGVVDYAEVVHRAVLIAETPAVRERLRRRWAAVFVDEYQDIDPAQERLLQALAGQGRHLVAVGDPDQSIYAFRGADVGALLEFPGRFVRLDGSRAPVLTLRRSRRAGASLLAASRALTSRMPVRALPRERVAEHRALTPVDAEHGTIDVRLHPSTGAELEDVADVLRRAHLEDGIAWSSMAVLVRSGRRSVPLVRRVLGAAGVPVEVAGDELPLAREPAVVPLLTGLRVAASREVLRARAAGDETWPPASRVEDHLTEEVAAALLASPLAAVDPSDLRALARELRTQDREAGAAPVPSAEALRDALAQPARLVAADQRVAGRVRALGLLLARVGTLLAEGGAAQDALWLLWEGTDWSARLQRSSDEGGASGRAADRDLDAVCALFDTVSRAGLRRGAIGALDLLAELEAEEIPGHPASERGVSGVRGDGSGQRDAVRVLTAHRAKGLEWDVVVVPGVQEGVWPDLRRRGSLLEPDRLGRGGLVEPPGFVELLAEERRLFYVAVTRARRRLVVSAVDSGEDDGERPSRFLAELGVEVVSLRRRRARPLAVGPLVAELRRIAVDPRSSPALVDEAVARLAELATARDDHGRVLVPSAHPDAWWGMLDVTDPGQPLRDGAAPVRLSGSALTGLTQCPLRWFLSHEVHADVTRSSAVSFGSVLHVLADEVARGALPPDATTLNACIDAVWSRLAFDAPWQSEQQRRQAYDAVERLLTWHTSAQSRGRGLLGSEVAFEVEVATPTGPVTLRGSADRLEVDAQGRVYVVDFKTGRSPLSGDVLAAHPQLGVYQTAVAAGAFDDVPGATREPGGAQLVHLRLPAGSKRADEPKTQTQPVPTPDEAGVTWVDIALGEAARRMRDEDFAPVTNETCDRCVYRRTCPARPEGHGVLA